MDYQLELKQIVDFPRCRIYRDFIRSLVVTRAFRTNGGSFLFTISFFAPMPITARLIGEWRILPT